MWYTLKRRKGHTGSWTMVGTASTPGEAENMGSGLEDQGYDVRVVSGATYLSECMGGGVTGGVTRMPPLKL